jgi:hypothetical protein
MSPITSTLANASAYGYRSFAAATVPAFESIATATGSGQTSVTFSSIPSTYKHLQIRIIARDNSGNGGGSGALRLRFNGDTSSVYDRHNLSGNGSSPSAGSDINSNDFSLDALMMGGGTGANIFGVGILDIIDYASTTKNKTLRLINGNNTNNTFGNEFIRLQSGCWRNTSAISSIELYISNGSGYETGTTISLYGIKGA